LASDFSKPLPFLWGRGYFKKDVLRLGDNVEMSQDILEEQ
jgi:hypothetical protein